MTEADIILTPLPQADGQTKLRPALILRIMPGYGDYLVCGISSNLKQNIENFDVIIRKNDSDFGQTGLIKDSIFRLSFLAVLPSEMIVGSIGKVSKNVHVELLKRLSKYLTKETTPGL
ncbi:MAG: transcriptional regulator [Bacteroidetes bacterium RIFOXYA12_FULL_35_11]|nr:MAG: transcriptional regulator [Bacteroidetes bacterium GWF2_35_48]OFY79228.1 MAG: transcriptional regulator [Bacteroidetes bacterium RIFOXYA12_FULL_35_11]OFY96415.1 MAG: transcriptional regulator [Bacteroidetes bacterium RIFOXYB2_FULL_35_7]